MTPPPSTTPSRRAATTWGLRFRRGALLSFVVALVVMLNPSATLAHEFGPFAIDRYAAIRVAPDEIELDYVLSLAETPTQADGEAIEADPEAYCTSLATEIELLVDGTALTLSGLTTSTLRQDGDGGLTTLRVVCNWVTPIEPFDAARTVGFDDANFSGRVGWREVIAVGDRTAVTGDVSRRVAHVSAHRLPGPIGEPRCTVGDVRLRGVRRRRFGDPADHRTR
jgi:nickel/cobalt transporter (NicO) family protein